MRERQAVRPHDRATKNARRVTVACLVVATFSTGENVCADAYAMVGPARIVNAYPYDHNKHNFANHGRYGNGVHNLNNIAVNSPNFNRGFQHSNDAAVNGSVNKQTALCKKRWRSCKIVQRMAVFGH